jgi:hypothetical protein
MVDAPHCELTRRFALLTNVKIGFPLLYERSSAATILNRTLISSGVFLKQFTRERQNDSGFECRTMQFKETEMTYRRIAALLIAGLLVAGSAFAREKKLNRSELPAAVETALQLESQGTEVKHLSQENENGQIFYKAKMKVDGRSKEVLINANGDVLRAKEKVPIDRIPAEVRAEIEARAGFLGHIAEVDSITKNYRLVAYEARVEKPVFFVPGLAVVSSTVQVAADGKKLDHKE